MVNAMGWSVGLSVAFGLILLHSFVYISILNYLYRKYRPRFENKTNIFDTSSSKETFYSMLDALLIGLVTTKVVTASGGNK